MNNLELLAQEHSNRKRWDKALLHFNQLLDENVLGTFDGIKVATYLFGRSNCYLELGDMESAISDCKRVVKLLRGREIYNNIGTNARRRLIYCFLRLHRIHEAHVIAQDLVDITNNSPEDESLLQRTLIAIRYADISNNPEVEYIEDGDICTLDVSIDVWCRELGMPINITLSQHSDSDTDKSSSSDCILENDDVSPNERNSTRYSSDNSSITSDKSKSNDCSSDEENTDVCRKSLADVEITFCKFCNEFCKDLKSFREHCALESHKSIIASDEGRDWKYRPPPRGLISPEYMVCPNFGSWGVTSCQYGAQCIYAHGLDELNEWVHRFYYRQERLIRARKGSGTSYTSQLIEKWNQTANIELLMSEEIEGITEKCDEGFTVLVESRNTRHEWLFTITTKHYLKAIAFLFEANRNHYYLLEVKTVTEHGKILIDEVPIDNQEWISSLNQNQSDVDNGNLTHLVKIGFSVNIYGTFHQSIVFDFGFEPLLLKRLCVDMVPVKHKDAVKGIQNGLLSKCKERWTGSNVNIIPFSKETLEHSKRELNLLRAYPPPNPGFNIASSTVLEPQLTCNNYREIMHQLLYIEELAQYEQISKYNLRTYVTVTDVYQGGASSMYRYAVAGELFMPLNMSEFMSEDTVPGRLILNNCMTILFTVVDDVGGLPPNSRRAVYESLIMDKGKNTLHVRLSKRCVEMLNLKSGMQLFAEIQFQLNRIPYCELHRAIDNIADYKMIFPDALLPPDIEISKSQRKCVNKRNQQLNAKQKKAINLIVTANNISLPPILILGSYGTGKTHTVAQAIKEVLLLPGTQVLVCTHSNSAADIYVKDYLHPYIEEGHLEARPLRIYYSQRWIYTVHPTVLKYCLVEGNESFKIPTVEDIKKHRIIVVTLSISGHLSSIGLPKGYFTHIFVDEAAQALECETITPLALAKPSTRIVLAGDHMQLGPEVYSEFAIQRNLHVSLLERLFDHYPSKSECKILLTKNYRAHESIVDFTSQSFYTSKLTSCGSNSRHPTFYPLTFFAAQGEDELNDHSASYFNCAEIYQVLDCITEMIQGWPPEWGRFEENSIGILTPYSDQVMKLRGELRKVRLSGVSVERVLNVQGKQFRAIIISTVRTRRACNQTTNVEKDYGFLSNLKLLNTAITRAQSLILVVGDPVALCTIGKCRKVWERYLEICDKNNSLYGIDWKNLKEWLDKLEFSRTALSPFAKEFVPSYLRVGNSTIVETIPPMIIDPAASMPIVHHAPNMPVHPFRPPAPMVPSVNLLVRQYPFIPPMHLPVSNGRSYVPTMMLPTYPDYAQMGNKFPPPTVPYPLSATSISDTFPSLMPNPEVSFTNNMNMKTIPAILPAPPPTGIYNPVQGSSLNWPRNIVNCSLGNHNLTENAISNMTFHPPGYILHQPSGSLAAPVLPFKPPLIPVKQASFKSMNHTAVKLPQTNMTHYGVQSKPNQNGIISNPNISASRACSNDSNGILVDYTLTEENAKLQEKKMNGPTDWHALLPQNYSLAELLMDQEKQEDWYKTLVKDDMDTATRFKDLIELACKKGSPIQGSDLLKSGTNQFDSPQDMKTCAASESSNKSSTANNKGEKTSSQHSKTGPAPSKQGNTASGKSKNNTKGSKSKIKSKSVIPKQ